MSLSPTKDDTRINVIKTNFYMKLYRSQRQSKSKTIWKEKNVPSAVRDPKITKRTDRTEQKTAFKPIVSGSLSKTFEFDVNQLSNLPVYKPSLELRFEHSKSLLKDLSELNTFQKLLVLIMIDKIIKLTNNYVKNVYETNLNKKNDSKSFSRS